MSVFDPLPLLSNPHVQTVLGNLLSPWQQPSSAVQRVVPLPDGDHIVLHETPTPLPSGGEVSGVRAGPPLALLVHGLGGSHLSPYMVRMTQRLNDHGWHVFRMDMRAAGAGLRLARRFYNAACSADVGVVVEHLAAAFPHSPVAVVGFSLGGNIVLKYAGEIGAQPPPSLRAIATLAPPIDLLRCAGMIVHHPLYDAFFVRHLTRQVAQHEEAFPELPRVVFPRRTSLRQFDDLYTAPRWGYADALDYYRRASAYPWIDAIRVPTFILTARDDPFVAVEPFEALKPPPSVEVHISAHGGHLGFLGTDGAGGFRWAETQLVKWLIKTVGGPRTV
jgi:hypothetical protein